MLTFVEDKTEWAGTTITFDIARRATRTEVVFTHLGLEARRRMLRYLFGRVDVPRSRAA